MVDLVKIRRKAKEKKEAGQPEEPRASTPPPSGEEASPTPRRSARGRSGEKREGTAVPGRDGAEASATTGRRPAAKGERTPAADVGGAGETPAKAGGMPAPEGGEGAERKLERFREMAGRVREGAERRGGGEERGGEEERLELLTFTMAGEQYAIDIETIVEIIAPRQVTPVPNAPSPVVGILSLRGTIVTMLDLRRELGHGSNYAVGPETRTIVVEDGGGMAGFVVDRVLRVVKIEPGQIQHHPVVSAAEQSEAIRGVFQQGTGLTIVLDVGRLLGRGEGAAAWS